VVVAFAGELPAFRHVVPYTACTMAEEFMRQGRHALVVYDDLSKHAVTYREISALLKRPIGREAYPGDIFFVHSRLLERAARLRDDLGGGSLTALPIVETLAGDISAFIPTNVISICDGQIFLDARRFNEGFRPAMDVGLSVSRVGGMAQTPAMRKVAGRLRIDLAQYDEMARFVKFGAEVDPATLQQLRRGEREIELLKQDAHDPLPLEKEIVTLYAAVNGYADDVPLEELRSFERELHAFMDRSHPDVLGDIRDARDLPAPVEERLRVALGAFQDAFVRERLTPEKVSV
jgi:F-type H+-transporting ATPase subunit alpha